MTRLHNTPQEQLLLDFYQPQVSAPLVIKKPWELIQSNRFNSPFACKHLYEMPPNYYAQDGDVTCYDYNCRPVLMYEIKTIYDSKLWHCLSHTEPREWYRMGYTEATIYDDVCARIKEKQLKVMMNSNIGAPCHRILVMSSPKCDQVLWLPVDMLMDYKSWRTREFPRSLWEFMWPWEYVVREEAAIRQLNSETWDRHPNQVCFLCNTCSNQVRFGQCDRCLHKYIDPAIEWIQTCTGSLRKAQKYIRYLSSQRVTWKQWNWLIGSHAINSSAYKALLLDQAFGYRTVLDPTIDRINKLVCIQPSLN